MKKTCNIPVLLMLSLYLYTGSSSAQVTGDSLCLKLRMAAWEGDYESLKNIIDTSETDIDCYAPYEMNALGYAIEEGHENIAELLLSSGADPNHRYNGITPLDRAVMFRNLNIAELLILYGADANKKSDTGMSPLIRAVNTGDHIMIDMLLHYGANPDITLYDSTSPFLLAVMYADYEAAALLAGYGADINKADKNGFTPLMISAWLNDTIMAKWLLELGALTDPLNYQGWDALAVALSVSSTEMVQMLLPLSTKVKPGMISDLAVISRNRELKNLVASQGYKTTLRPVIISWQLNYGIIFNNEHLMGNYSFGIKDIKYNTVLTIGFMHRYKPATIFHTPDSDNSLVYQVQGKRYMIYTSLEKLFVMFERPKHSLSLSAGLLAGYSGGSFKGTAMKPWQGIKAGMRGGVIWETKNFSFGIYYQHLQFNESPVPKDHITAETSLVFPFKKYTVTPKKMPYVLTL